MATAHFVIGNNHDEAECEACLFCGNEDLGVWMTFNGSTAHIECTRCGVCGPTAQGHVNAITTAIGLWDRMCGDNIRLRQIIEDTALVLTEDIACRPADECPDLSAYADGHCDLVALAKRWIEIRKAR